MQKNWIFPDDLSKSKQQGHPNYVNNRFEQTINYYDLLPKNLVPFSNTHFMSYEIELNELLIYIFFCLIN